MASIRRRAWSNSKGETKVAWVVDYLETGGNRRRKHFVNKKSADAFRIHIEGQIQRGTYRSDADKTAVAEVCESFLEYCLARNQRNERMTRKTLLVYTGHVRNHIPNPGYGVGASKLSRLTARAVGDFRDRLRDANVTVPTVRKILATLHTALEYAVSQDWVATNAAHGTRVIGPRDEGSKKIVPPSKENMRSVIEAAQPDLRLMLVFAASTGARAGEQWAARWRDVDLDAGLFHIRQRVDAYGDEGPPKSAAGIRTVPISSQLIMQLRAWRLKSKFKSSDDLVFSNHEGRHVSHDNLVKRHFIPLLDHVERKAPEKQSWRRFNWHALRHFAISCWIEVGFTPKAVQTFAGHASLQVTMDRYGHLFPKEDHKKAMDQIARDLIG